MIGKRLRKIMRQLFLTFCILKKKKYVHLPSQKLIGIVPTLLRAIASKHYGHFYFLNRNLHSFRTENKIKSHENVRKNKDFCEIVMPLEKDIISEFNQYMKSDKMPYIIYADDSKAFIEYWNDMDYIYKNIETYNQIKKRKILIVFDDMIAAMLSNKILNSIVTELFIRARKLNIYIVFITQSYFSVTKNIKLSYTHYFLKKIPNRWEPQKIASNHLSDIYFNYFMNLYKKVLKIHVVF